MHRYENVCKDARSLTFDDAEAFYGLLLATVHVYLPLTSPAVTFRVGRYSNTLSLTLGAHAQRGLRYLVSLSVCLSVRRLANLAVQETGRSMTATNRFRVARSLILIGHFS